MSKKNIFKNFVNKSQGSMKKIKKGEVAIYAIALMLVAAGYFNYSNFESETKQTYSEDISSASNEYANVGDAVLVSNNEVQNESTTNQQETENAIVNNEADDMQTQNIIPQQTTTEETASQETNETNTSDQNQKDQSTEVKQVNAEVTGDEENYYANSKLERDKMYAQMLSTYQEILNNTKVTEAQKTIATQEIAKINNNKNAIMICENLILTKGFNNCVILINDASVNVVVNIEGGLTTEAVAKIQNIISRELNTQIENIHITEK